MFNFRRFSRWLAGFLVVCSCAVVRANITVQYSYVSLTGSTNANTLNANGWIGIKFTAFADTNSKTVSGFDLVSNGNGIYAAAMQQRWTLTDPNHTGTWTKVTTSVGGAVPAGLTSSEVDSFFDSFDGRDLLVASPLLEDSNMTGGTGGVSPNPPYNHSPLNNGTFSFGAFMGGGPGSPQDDFLAITALNSGVGTSLHGEGAFAANQSAVQPLAFIIVPSGTAGSIIAEFKGELTDGTPQAAISSFDILVPSPLPIPEPASAGLSLVALTVFLGCRRRPAH